MIEAAPTMNPSVHVIMPHWTDPCLYLLVPQCTELMIQEKEKLYVELKNIIARQPGPDIEEQVRLG